MSGNYKIYLFYLFTCILVLNQCTPPSSSSATKDFLSEPDSSSIIAFENFEEIADHYPEKYVLQPDSFLEQLNLHPKTAEQNEIYSYGLIFMGYGLREYGDHYSSIKYYEKALHFIKQHAIQDIDIHLYIIKPLAALYTTIDDNQKAIQLLEQVLHEIPKNNYEHHVGFANNLANAYLYDHDVQKAKKLLLETTKTPASTPSKALLYNSLSTVFQEENDLANSRQYNHWALQLFRRQQLHGESIVWYSSALGQYGELHNDLPATEQAIDILNKLSINSQNRTKARLYLTKANILYDTKDYSLAKKSYHQTETLLSEKVGDKYTLDYTYTQALVGIANCLSNLHQSDSALYYFQWAIENDFRTQQLITSKKNQINNNIWNRDIIEQMSILVDKKLQDDPNNKDLIKTLLWCIELSKGRLLINEINRSEHWNNASTEVKDAIQKIRHLYQKINQSTDENQRKTLTKQINKTTIDFQLSERYFETFNYAPDQDTFFEKLNCPQKDFFSYYIHKNNTITVIGKLGNRFTYHRITDTLFLESILHFKASYFGNSPNNFNLDPQHYYRQAQNIVKQLLPNLKANNVDIHLSLDGSLYGLPFDALYDEHFLIQDHNFAYLNSFILYDLLETPKAKETEITLLYRSLFPKPLPNLNFVQEEVSNIRQSFVSRDLAPDQQNDTTIVQQFANSRVIHIASHTILDKEASPIIYLHNPISTEQLRFYQIKSPLIFLSACNTGSGKSLPSEGMESIQRVFLGKGVPSVISTYWFANDEAMLQLTNHFYQELYKTKKPIEALANAKRIFLDDASIEQHNPWYWANINYAGIGNEIGLRKVSNLSTYIGVGMFLFLSILLLKYLRSNTTLVKKDKKTKYKPD